MTLLVRQEYSYNRYVTCDHFALDVAHSRKSKIQPGQLLRRNTEPPHMMPDDALAANNQPTIAARQEFVAQAERRSTASIYILCRVLMEVIGQSTLSCITPEMEEKLEGMFVKVLIKISFGKMLNDEKSISNNSFLFQFEPRL